MAARGKMMLEGKKGRAGQSLRLLELNRTGSFETSIPSFRQTSSKGWTLMYTRYEIQITCGKLQWIKEKRYSEFHDLRSACLRKIDSSESELRQTLVIPGKNLFMKKRDHLERKKGLEDFLHAVQKIPQLHNTLTKFLGFDESDTHKAGYGKAGHKTSRRTHSLGAVRYTRTIALQKLLQPYFMIVPGIIEVILMYEEIKDLKIDAHEMPILALSMSKCGYFIASGSKDKSIKIWDRITGAPVTTLLGHSGIVFSLAFQNVPNQSGIHLASGGSDKTVRIWTIGENDTIFKEPLSRILWGHRGPVRVVCYSSSDDRLASCGEDEMLGIWPINEGKVDGTSGKFFKTQDRVVAMEFTADGKHLVCSMLNREIQMIDHARGGFVKKISLKTQSPQPIRGLSCSRDGKLVALGCGNSIIVWKTFSLGYTDVQLSNNAVYNQKSTCIISVAFNSKSNAIISTSYSAEGSNAVLWRYTKTSPSALAFKWVRHPIYNGAGIVYKAMFSPDDSQICFACQDGSLRIQNL